MKFNKENFRLVRKKKKVSLKKITSQIGKSYRTLLAWEKGERNPGESDIRVLAQLLDISVSEISDLEDFAVSNTPYYHNSLGALEQIQREFSGELSIKKQTYLLNLKNELEHLTSEVKMLRRINGRQKLVIDSLHTFIYTKDTKFKYTDANAAFLSYLNIPLEEIIGKNNRDLFIPKDAEELTNIEKEVLTKGVRVSNREITIPGSNGKKHGVLSVYPVYNDDGKKVTRIICSLKDISALSAEKKRRKMMEITINQLDDAIWIVLDKPVPHFLFLSNAMAKIYGRPLDDFYNDHKLWIELVHPDDRKRVLNTLKQTKDFPRKTQYRIIHPDNSIHWIESRAYKKTDEQYDNLVFGTLRDITKEKEAEAEKTLLHSVIDKFEEVIWIGSKNKHNKGDFELHYINSRACEEMIGYSDTDLLADPDIWINRIHPDDRERMLAEINSGNLPRESIYRIIHRDNTVKYIEDREFVAHNSFHFGFLKDISKDKYNSELLRYFKDSVNQLNGIFWIKEVLPEEKIIFISDAIESVIGFNSEKITSKLWHSHILVEDRIRVEKAYKTIAERKIPLGYKIKHKDGSIHAVDEVWFKMRKMGTKTIKFGFIRDKTDIDKV